MQTTTDSFWRISETARQWSSCIELTLGQRVMARILERRAPQLAVTSLLDDKDLETFRLVYGHLYKAVGGVEPSVGVCPFDASAA
jgi:hypothetical protein